MTARLRPAARSSARRPLSRQRHGGIRLFSRFFIDRPIFASVLSIIVITAGWRGRCFSGCRSAASISADHAAQRCRSHLPLPRHADAQVVAETARARPIEQQVNGVERMLYMSSQSTNDGSVQRLTVTSSRTACRSSTWPRCWCRTASSLAAPAAAASRDSARPASPPRRNRPRHPHGHQPHLPEGWPLRSALSEQLCATCKSARRTWPGAAEGSATSSLFRRARLQHADLGRSGQAGVAGPRRGRRGECGSLQNRTLPSPWPWASSGSRRRRAVRISRIPHDARLAVWPRPLSSSPTSTSLKTTSDGPHVVRLKDVARVELGAKNIDVNSRVNGLPSPAARLAHLAASRRQRLRHGRPRPRQDGISRAGGADFPDGLEYVDPLRHDALHSRIDCRGRQDAAAMRSLLVAMAGRAVVPLQNWRLGPLIPLIAVPVAIIGTFAVMAAVRLFAEPPDVVRPGAGADPALSSMTPSWWSKRSNGTSSKASGAACDATIKAMEQVSGPTGDRGRPRPQRGVRAVPYVHQRHHRSVLSPIRHDDRRLDAHLDV